MLIEHLDLNEVLTSLTVDSCESSLTVAEISINLVNTRSSVKAVITGTIVDI